MALTQIATPYPIFTDTDGKPLDDGYLYFGEVSKNPETNPIQVYWDSALTQPVAQPIRTSNGYPWRNGSPALIYANSQFSVTIRNKKNELVLYSPVGYGIDPASVTGNVYQDDHTGDGSTVSFSLSVTPATELATQVFIDGVYQNKAGYSVSGNAVVFDTAPPLNSAIEIIIYESSVIGATSSNLVSYSEGSVGAAERTVQDKLRESASVLDFGADPTGATDSTSAFQAALTAGNIYVPDGTYKYSGVINVPSNRVIIGQSFNAIMSQNAADIECFNLDDAINVTITNLAFNGNDLGSTLSSTVNTAITSSDTVEILNKNCTIEGCSFKNYASWAIDFKGAGAGTYSYGVSIKGNYLDGMLDEGINFYYIQSGLIQGNILTDHKREGIKVTSSSRVIVDNNVVKCNGTSVPDLQGPLINLGTNVNFCTVSNNYCWQGTISIGLEKGVTYTTVVGNVCENPSTMGIGASNSNVSENETHHVTISGNVCKGGTPINIDSVAGIRPYGIVISSNTCETSDAYPCINVEYTEDCTITSNHLTGGGTGKDGIAIANTHQVTIDGNTIYSSDQWGIDINNCENAIVSDNVIVNPNQAASISYGGVNIATTVINGLTRGNSVYGSAGTFFIGVYNRATNAVFDQNYAVGYTNAAQRGTGSGRTSYFTNVQLGVTNSLAATTPGSVTNKIEVFDAVGNSIGFVPVYDSIS